MLVAALIIEGCSYFFFYCTLDYNSVSDAGMLLTCSSDSSVELRVVLVVPGESEPCDIMTSSLEINSMRD